MLRDEHLVPATVLRCNFGAMAKALQKLGPHHREAVRMKIGGASGREISEALGIRLRTVYLWFGDALVKAELSRQIEQADDHLKTELAMSALHGLQRLRELLEEPIGVISFETKLAAISDILDRCPWTTK